MSELRYHPVLGDAPSLVAELRPARLLVVGEGVPDTVAAASATRLCPTAEPALPTGSYLFASAKGTDMLLVWDGDPPAGPEETGWLSDDHPLVHAYGSFLHWWETASAVPPPRFSVGDDVITVPSGQAGIVRSRTFA